jgi:hypothetical protein
MLGIGAQTGLKADDFTLLKEWAEALTYTTRR